MAWKLYKPSLHFNNGYKEPMISLKSTRGTYKNKKYEHFIIIFHRKSRDIFKINNPKYAILFYDNIGKIVGIKLTKKKTKHAYKINPTNYSFSATSFCRYFNLESKIGTYPLKWDDKNKLYVFKLINPSLSSHRDTPPYISGIPPIQ